MKGNETSDAYLNRAKEYVDALANIGEAFKEKYLVMLVIMGLREDYNGLKSTLLARQAPTAFHELQGLLADHDYMIKQSVLIIPSQTRSSQQGSITTTSGTSSQIRSSQQDLVKENQEKDKIGSKPDKNRKRGEAGKSLNQLQLEEEEKPKKTKKEWPKTHTQAEFKKGVKSLQTRHPIRIQFMKHATDVALVTFHHISPTVTLLPFETCNNFWLIMLIIALNLSHGFLTLVSTAMYHQILLASALLNHTMVRFFSMLAMDETSGTTLLAGPSKHGLYSINLSSFQPVPRSVFTTVRAPVHTWHQWLGHPHSQLLHSMLSKYSLFVLDKTSVASCNACHGPAPVTSTDGHNYFLFWVDHYTR
nr:nucleotide-binding, alpha-beta plait [Tanacetum cinerariifolium]